MVATTLLLCCMILFVPEPFMIFSVSYNCVIVVTVIYDVILALTLSFKIRNKWKRKEKMRIIKNKPSPIFIILTNHVISYGVIKYKKN